MCKWSKQANIWLFFVMQAVFLLVFGCFIDCTLSNPVDGYPLWQRSRRYGKDLWTVCKTSWLTFLFSPSGLTNQRQGKWNNHQQTWNGEKQKKWAMKSYIRYKVVLNICLKNCFLVNQLCLGNLMVRREMPVPQDFVQFDLDQE